MIFLAGTFLLTACGREKSGGDETLRVSVQLPSGEPEEYFWFGVDRKELEVTAKGESRVYEWVSGKILEIDLKEGDEVAFRGLDALGRILVQGTATVDQAKSVSIPLRRVL